MSNLIPLPPVPISVRVATRDDLPFIDGLQKANRKALGFFPRAQLEGYIDNGWVLIAEATVDSGELVVDRNTGSSLSTLNHQLSTTPLGYCASRDRYLKRDELGAIFQMCVVPEARGKLVAANLLREVFERSAYGTKLYCCWCAQDLEANRFWASMGFVPIAFRTESRSKGAKRTPRVHLFWQKRIRADDTTTPWWYPCQTGGGAIREDRLVLPIPPGVRWSDDMPVLLPAAELTVGSGQLSEKKEKHLPRGANRTSAAKGLPSPMGDGQSKTERPTPTIQPSGIRVASTSVLPLKRPLMQSGLMRFGGAEPETQAAIATPIPTPKPAKSRRESKPKAKADPALIAKARELRDRYLEHVNANEATASMPSFAKYDVSRRIDASHAIEATVDVRHIEAVPSSAAERMIKRLPAA